MADKFVSDLSGLRDELISGLRALRKEVEQESKKVGQAVSDGYEDGYEESVEEVRKSKKELLHELDDAKRKFEQSLSKMPDAWKKFTTTLGTKDLTRVTKALNNAINKMHDIKFQLSEIGEHFDISEWLDSMHQQMNMLFDTNKVIETQINANEKLVDTHKQLLKEQKKTLDLNEKIQKAKKAALDEKLANPMLGLEESTKAVEARLTEVVVRMQDIESEAKDAKKVFDELNESIAAYSGKPNWKTADYRDAIQGAWNSGKKDVAVSLYEDFQESFPKQVWRLNPVDMFGDDWANTFSQNLETANRQLTFLRNKLEATADAYGKFAALMDLEQAKGSLISKRDTLAAEAERTTVYDHKSREQRKANNTLIEADAAKKKVEATEGLAAATERAAKAQRELNAAEAASSKQQGARKSDLLQNVEIIEDKQEVYDAKTVIQKRKVVMEMLKDAINEYKNMDKALMAPDHIINGFEYEVDDDSFNKQRFYIASLTAAYEKFGGKISSLTKGAKTFIEDWGFSGQYQKDLDSYNSQIEAGISVTEEQSKANERLVDTKEAIYKNIQNKKKEFAKLEDPIWDSSEMQDDEKFLAFKKEELAIAEKRYTIASELFELQKKYNDAEANTPKWNKSIDKKTDSVKASDFTESTVGRYKELIELSKKSLDRAIEQIETKTKQQQMTKTGELIGELQRKYGENYNKEFNDVVNSFGSLNVNNAQQMYDALIAREKDYLKQIQQRQTAMANFMQANQDILKQYQKSEDFMKNFEKLSVGIMSGTLTEVEANQQLLTYIDSMATSSNEAADNIQILETRVKNLVDIVNQIPQEPNTTRFVHFTDTSNNASILENGLALNAGMFQSHAVEIKEYVEVVENGIDTVSRAVNVLQSHSNAGNAIIIDIPTDSIIAYDSAVGGLEVVHSDFVKAAVNTEDGLISLNKQYNAAHDVIEDYAKAVRDAKTAEEGVRSRRPGTRRSDSLEAVRSRITSNRLAKFDEDVASQEMLDDSESFITEFQLTARELRNKVADGAISCTAALTELTSHMVDFYESTQVSTEEVSRNIRQMSNDERQKMFVGVDLKKLFDGYNVSKDNRSALQNELEQLGNLLVSQDLGVSQEDINNKINDIVKLVTQSAERQHENDKSLVYALDELGNYRTHKIHYDESVVAKIGSRFNDIKSLFGEKLTMKNGAGILAPDEFFASLSDGLQSVIKSTFESIENAPWTDATENILLGIGHVFSEAMAQSKSSKYSYAQVTDPDEIKFLEENTVALISKAVNNVEQLLHAESAVLDVVEETNEEKKEGLKLQEQAVKQSQKSSSDKKDDGLIDANWILKQDQNAAISRAQSAKLNIVEPVVNLSGVYSIDELDAEVRNAAKNIVDGSDLTFGKLHIADNIASIQLFNKELGKTVVDWYKVSEATDDATKSQLKYVTSTLDLNAEAARKYTSAQQAKIDKDNRWAIQQLSKLDKQELSYKDSSKKISGDTAIIYDNDIKTIDNVVADIRQRIQGAMNGTISETFKNDIRDALRVLDTEIRREQSHKYQSGNLSAQEVTEALATRRHNLDAFEAKAIKNNVFNELEEDIKAMRAALDSVTEEDAGGLQKFIDKMRTARAHYESEIAQRGIVEKEQSNYKNAEKALDRLFEARKKLARIEAEGETDAELSRRVNDLEKEYDATTKLLQSEQAMNDILTRQATLEGELKDVKKQTKEDQIAKQKAAVEKEQAETEKKRIEQLRSFYSERVKIQKELNHLDSQLNDMTLKGAPDSQIQDIQTLKSSRIADLRTLTDQVNQAMSTDGVEYTGGFAGFLEHCRESAILTGEEIQDLNKILMQSEHIAQNFEIASASQQQKNKEQAYKRFIELQKKYNDADYGWHQADISGADKTPYNVLMQSYIDEMQQLRKEVELTAEQQAEFDRINNEHNAKKNKFLDDTVAAESKKREQELTKALRLQDQLYDAEMKLAKLEEKGDVGSADWQNAARLVEERKKEAQAAFDILQTEESISEVINRRTQYESQLSTFKQDSATAKSKKQSEEDSKQYYTQQNERLKSWAQYGYKYGDKTVDDQREIDSMSEFYKREQEKADQYAKDMQSTYSKLLSFTKQINELDVKLNDLAIKDKGSGLYSGWINNLQTQKSSLFADVRKLGTEIAQSLSVDSSQAIPAFLDKIQQEAIVTTEEVQKFTDALTQAENIKFNFGAKIATLTEPVVEKITSLKTMIADGSITNGIVKSNVSNISTELNNKYNAFKKSGSQSDAIDYLKYAEHISEYISQLDKAAKKEAQYFSNKNAYINIGTLQDYDVAAKNVSALEDATNSAQKSLEKYVQEFYNGQAIVTDFVTDANGISKINFSVFEEGSNQFRTFGAEMGQFTDRVYTYETSMKNLTAGSDAAQKAMNTLNEAVSRLQQLKYEMPEIDVDDQMNKLQQAMLELNAKRAEVGVSKDFGSQTALKNVAAQAQSVAKEASKLEQQWLKTWAAIESGDIESLGKIDKHGNVMAQMFDKIKISAGDAAISNVKFDDTTNTLTYTLTKASGEIENITARMDKYTGVVVKSVDSTGKLKTWWQDLGSGLGGGLKDIGRYAVNMLQVMDIIRYLRQGFNEVLAIDTALTELRKVTDETDATYNKFLQTMSKTGAVVGSTVKDLTTSASDWARLNI